MSLRFVMVRQFPDIAKENVWFEVPLDVGLFERHDLSAEFVLNLQNHVMAFLQDYVALVYSIADLRCILTVRN